MRVAVTQVPAPSHSVPETLPAVHVDAPHAVVLGAYTRHAPAPSHRPSALHEDGNPGSFVHVAPGFAGLPAINASQTPSRPKPLLNLVHASHGRSHFLSQQTPSTQKPDAHSSLVVHRFGVQLDDEYLRHAPAPSHTPSSSYFQNTDRPK